LKEETITIPEMGIRGLIKVELRDSQTGEITNELETHNFISPKIIKTLYALKVMDIFTTGRLKAGFSPSSLMKDPFAQISLTDATHPEDPTTEWLRKGQLVAWALSDASYTGNSTVQGRYNTAESTTDFKSVKMVFDFDTNVGNGTFQSIYFNPKDSVYGSGGATPGIANLRSLKVFGGKRYRLTSLTSTSNALFEELDADDNPVSSFDLGDATIRDFHIRNNVIYYVRDSVTKSVQSAPLATPNVLTAVINLPFNAVGGLYFNEKTKEWYFANYSGNNTLWLIYNEALTTELRREPIQTAAGVSVGASYAAGPVTQDGDFLFIGRYYLDEKGHGFEMDRTNVCRGIDDKFYYIPGFRYPKTSIGSRALLKTPITKDSTQTMKITYEFILPNWL
jgi:hypothetical protein